MILACPADQQIFFFINQGLPVVFRHLEIGRQLDCISRACLFTIAAEDAPGEIDAKEGGITPAVFIFCGLQGYAIDRTGDGAEITGYAPLFSVRVAGKDYAPPPPCGDMLLLLGVLDRLSPAKGVKEDCPGGLDETQHVF
jgi:hypothetical protein